MNEKLIVATSPHFHGKVTTSSIMFDVLVALFPASIAAALFYGWQAIIMISVCVGTSVLSEYLFNKICKKKQTVGDLSAVVTGLILALSLPASANIWHCIVGSVFAIVAVKCLFGGLGCNFANPAVTARIFLLLAFSGSLAGGVQTQFASAELVSSATPLAVLKGAEGQLPSLTEMLIGNRGGSIGEGCAIALLIGFVYLLIKRIDLFAFAERFIHAFRLFQELGRAHFLSVSKRVEHAAFSGSILVEDFHSTVDHRPVLIQLSDGRCGRDTGKVSALLIHLVQLNGALSLKELDDVLPVLLQTEDLNTLHIEYCHRENTSFSSK